MSDIHAKTMKPMDDLKVFIETTIPVHPFSSDTLLIVIKVYDPYTTTLKLRHTLTVFNSDRVSVVLAKSGFENGHVFVYEEVKPGMIEKLDITRTFGDCEFITGDIIVLEPFVDVALLSIPSLAHVPAYFDLIQNRVEVLLRDRVDECEVKLVLSKRMGYEEVVRELGNHIGFEWSKLKLFTMKLNGKCGTAVFSKSSLVAMLASQPLREPRNLLYYERLDIPLSELDRKKYVTVQYLQPGKEHIPTRLLVDKHADVRDLIEGVVDRVEGEKVEHRAYEVFNSRITRLFKGDDPITICNDHASIFVEVLNLMT